MHWLRVFVIAALFCTCGASAFALGADYYAPSSRLASGHWVKISTTSEGIYQLTYDQLRALGFDEPERVQVYGYGALQLTENSFSEQIPDDLSPTATLHTADGRILFYGEGDATVDIDQPSGSNSFNIRRNYYDTASFYFLSDCEPVSTISVSPFVASSQNPQTSHIHAQLSEEELHSPSKGGIAYFGREYTPGDTARYEYLIQNYSPSELIPHGSFEYSFALSTTASARPVANASDQVNIIKKSCPSAKAITDDYTICTLANGFVTFEAPNGPATFTVAIPNKDAIYYCADNYTLLRYPRANRLDDNNFLVMHFTQAQRIAGGLHRFDDVAPDSTFCIWNIEHPYAISQYETVYDSLARTLTYCHAEPTARAIAFRPDAEFPAPKILGPIANQDLHSLPTPQMLIITTSEFEPQAQRLASLHHTYQNINATVVIHDLIYNEFASGARDAMAYRRFAKMFYDRDPLTFKYVLLLGVGAYDNRCVELSKVDRLLTYQNTNLSHSCHSVYNYTADLYFGMLADDYDHALIHSQPIQVAVGRIPAITPGETQSYINKVEHFLQTSPSADVFSRAILIAGEDDLNKHLNHQLEVKTAMEQAKTTKTFISIPMQLYVNPKATYDNPACHNIIANELTRGVGYLSFSGHGGTNYVSRYNILDTRKARTLTYSNPPFVMLSSCDQFAFDRMSSGLLETMLFAENGGAIAGVGAGRDVFVAFNQHSCVPTAQAYAMSRPGDTYGDIFRRARNITLADENATSTALINVMNYNFAGDPALPVRCPSFSAAITRIDSLEFVDSVSVKPLLPHRLEGFIADSLGQKIANFNGSATITILDCSKTDSTFNSLKESNYVPAEVTLEYDILATTHASVVDGEFAANLVLPVPAEGGRTHTIIVSATDSTSGAMAIAKGRKLNIDLLDTADLDSLTFDAPQILEFYIDSPDFAPGDEVASTITATAIISPSNSNLRLSTNDISTRTSLSLDSKQHYGSLESMITALNDSTWQLSTTLNKLTEGRHSLELTVANNAGLTDCATIDFVVITRKLSASLIIDNPVARTEAIIDAQGTLGTSNRLIITNASGQTVFSATDVALPFAWDLTDLDGSPVANGPYSVALLLRDGPFYGNAENAAQLIVVR